MDGNETELKLAVAPQALAKVRRLRLLRDHRCGRAAIQSLTSVYYDTPSRSLAEAGITVRLRKTPHGHVQTVKTAGKRSSGMFARREWESTVASDALDRSRLNATGLELLQQDSVLNALQPLFSTHIRRSVQRLAGDGWLVEMALDVGELRAGAEAQAICEVELELKEGQPRHLFSLARAIAESVPVRLLALSKSDRGYELAAGRGPVAVKSRPVVLSADTTLADSFRAIAGNCLHHLLANQQALLENADGEAVHQMRVALRRLRSALKIFRPLIDGPQLEPLRQELRWLLSQLGPARDAAVFLEEIIDPVVEGHREQEVLPALRRHWRAVHGEDVAAARAAAEGNRFVLLLLDLGAWVEAGEWSSRPLGRQDVGPFAESVLRRLARKLRKAGGKKLSRLSPPALHRVRILGKQLRYAAEFFAPLHGKELSGTLSQLGHLQDCLGELNDIAVAIPRLAACQQPAELAWAAGVVAGWHEARRPQLLARAEELWAAWRKRRAFRKR